MDADKSKIVKTDDSVEDRDGSATPLDREVLERLAEILGVSEEGLERELESIRERRPELDGGDRAALVAKQQVSRHRDPIEVDFSDQRYGQIGREFRDAIERESDVSLEGCRRCGCPGPLEDVPERFKREPGALGYERFCGNCGHLLGPGMVPTPVEEVGNFSMVQGEIRRVCPTCGGDAFDLDEREASLTLSENTEGYDFGCHRCCSVFNPGDSSATPIEELESDGEPWEPIEEESTEGQEPEGPGLTIDGRFYAIEEISVEIGEEVHRHQLVESDSADSAESSSGSSYKPVDPPDPPMIREEDADSDPDGLLSDVRQILDERYGDHSWIDVRDGVIEFTYVAEYRGVGVYLDDLGRAVPTSRFQVRIETFGDQIPRSRTDRFSDPERALDAVEAEIDGLGGGSE